MVKPRSSKVLPIVSLNVFHDKSEQLILGRKQFCGWINQKKYGKNPRSIKLKSNQTSVFTSCTFSSPSSHPMHRVLTDIVTAEFSVTASQMIKPQTVSINRNITAITQLTTQAAECGPSFSICPSPSSCFQAHLQSQALLKKRSAVRFLYTTCLKSGKIACGFSCSKKINEPVLDYGKNLILYSQRDYYSEMHTQP